MSNEIKLPSGNTVTIKDAKALTLKDRKYVFTNLSQNDLDNVGDMLDVLERVATVLVTEWSFDLIPPNIKPESFESLALDDFDAILREAQKVLPTLLPKLGDSDENVANPKVITAD
jgi:hypothetical protein